MMGLLLGRSLKFGSETAGGSFTELNGDSPILRMHTGETIEFVGERHVISIGGGKADRTTSAIVPNILHYPGPIVVLDTTGESYAATIRSRSEIGPVLRLDPFRIIDADSDAINPMDLMDVVTSNLELGCQIVADLIFPRLDVASMWERNAFGLLSAVVGYIKAVPEKNSRFSEIRKTFMSEDVVYNLAVVLDTIGKRLSSLSFSEIASFLQYADADRSQILATINSRNKALATEAVYATLDKSSIPLSSIVEGVPLTIYLMIPNDQLRNYSQLMRIWLGTILNCITSRRSVPKLATLFILDDVAQLSRFPIFESAITSCHNKDYQIWTFWDSVSQIRHLYPSTWLSIFKNCGVVQLYGEKDYSSAAETAAIIGVHPEDVRFLKDDELALDVNGSCHRVQKINFRTDPLFDGRFD